MGPQLRLVQTSLGSICVLTGAVVVVVKRPFQAPAENILESVLRSVNLVNAAVALLLAVVQETNSEPREGSVADTIVAPNWSPAQRLVGAPRPRSRGSRSGGRSRECSLLVP